MQRCRCRRRCRRCRRRRCRCRRRRLRSGRSQFFRTFGVRPDSGKRVISPELEQGGLWKEKNVLTLATAGQKVVRVSLQWPTLFINQATRGLGLIDVALNKHLASVFCCRRCCCCCCRRHCCCCCCC